jgi:hypothetical protein
MLRSLIFTVKRHARWLRPRLGSRPQPMPRLRWYS